ncbi:MAG TPA: hypothetical protein VG756_02205 [Pseudonocardiaceae bacterium]|nr:hypothetical protein [Pseudonocardiaceae bacterium]
MTGTMFAFPDDLRDPAELDRIAGYGCDSIAVAAAYHRARDVTPHGPTRVTVRHDGVYFPLPASEFGRLVPAVAGDGALTGIYAAARERGLAVSGWTVFLHNTTLGLLHPDVTQRNCFGERAAPADLCPAHPDVRAYVVALARAVADTGVDAVLAESLNFGFFSHGYHHERSFVDLGAIPDFLLGLCFCEFCRAEAEQAGVDAEAAARQARVVVDAVLNGGPPPAAELTRANLAELAGAELLAFVDHRPDTVTGLVREVADALRDKDCALCIIDGTGALKGYGDGLPTGVPAARDTWRIGVDPAAIGALVKDYVVLAYARKEQRITEDIAAYRELLGPDRRLRAVLRPGEPDTDDAAHLAAKVSAVRKAGADSVDFYNYGMCPLPVLDRITHALS